MIQKKWVDKNGKEHVTKVEDSERTRPEVWSRVMGYFRPTTYWNIGKQGEWNERKMFKAELKSK